MEIKQDTTIEELRDGIRNANRQINLMRFVADMKEVIAARLITHVENGGIHPALGHGELKNLWKLNKVVDQFAKEIVFFQGMLEINLDYAWELEFLSFYPKEVLQDIRANESRSSC